MRVRRDISSIPLRSAASTWDAIVALASGAGSDDVNQLMAARPTIASIIADEIPAEQPFVFEGCGPQLRVYCRYGASSIQEGGDVDALTWNATAGDWTLRVPCDAENLEWVRKSLARTSPRLAVYDVADGESAGNVASPIAGEIVVDWSVKDIDP